VALLVPHPAQAAVRFGVGRVEAQGHAVAGQGFVVLLLFGEQAGEVAVDAGGVRIEFQRRSRARACRELGLDLRLRDWDGHGSLVAFVVSLNLHRRHLSESQRALVAARIKPLFEAEAKQRMLAGKAIDPMANLPQGPARDQAAAILGVSPRSVEAAGNVLKQGTPELIQGVESGQVSVSAASDLAELPPDEQRDVVAGGKKAAVAKAKQLRQKKAGRRPAKKTSDPKPGTGSGGSSGADGEKPTAGDKASAAKTDGILIRKSDKITKIARA
jgi:hypothetical protein